MQRELDRPQLANTIEINGVNFNFETVETERRIVFLSEAGITLGGGEPFSQFEGMSPLEISKSARAIYSDGYYQFTKVKGLLIIGDKGKAYFDTEIDETPITYFGGGVVYLANIVNDPSWGNAARKSLQRGFSKAVIFERVPDRPFRARFYPLKDGDVVLP